MASHDVVGPFQFISSTQLTDKAQLQRTRRRVRSHAAKYALCTKRTYEQASLANFYVTTSYEKPRKQVSAKPLRTPDAWAVLVYSPSSCLLDPFQTLPVDSGRLQAFLCDGRARQAAEPVFSVAQELAFQSFHSVFQTTFSGDTALLSAVMLSFHLATTNGVIDREFLQYQGQALHYIRERVSSVEAATSASTIGAILLLAGVEARLGLKRNAELHMLAVHRLLAICEAQHVRLTSGLKRAIFWQDLYSSVLTGSKRVFGHTSFSELVWLRDPRLSTSYRLPPGFRYLVDSLPLDFVHILEDINSLRCIRETHAPSSSTSDCMQRINDHIASIHSRLTSLPQTCPVVDCCYVAAYLCSVMLCCKVWCALVIPSHLCNKLLRRLESSVDDPVWDNHTDLLLWLLYIGSAFSSDGQDRSGYITILRSKQNMSPDKFTSWPEVLSILRRFIWSEEAFMSPVKAIWDEVSATSPSSKDILTHDTKVEIAQ